MNLIECPITKGLHEYYRNEIKNRFDNICIYDISENLSLIQYVNNSPQKFFSEQTFKDFLEFLINLKYSNSKLLVDILKEKETVLNISNRFLNEINLKPIHDTHKPTDDIEIVDFIDKELHYNYLRILESTFFVYIYFFAAFLRTQRSKGIDGLDLYNCVEELKNSKYGYLSSVYNNTVRNGIAHGKIIYKDKAIEYIDKSKTYETNSNEILKTFDKLVDFTNGLDLAFRVFCFTNLDFFENLNMQIPQSIMIEEIKIRSKSVGWEVINMFDSVVLNDRKQIIIYTKNTFWDYNKVMYFTIRTALLTEKFTKKYDRLFFNIVSKHSLNGFSAIDSKILREYIESDFTKTDLLKNVVEGNLIFFVPFFRFPKIFYKIGTIKNIFKIQSPIEIRKIKENFGKNYFICRDNKFHSKKTFVVLQDTSVVIDRNYNGDKIDLIRNNYKKIISIAKRDFKKKCSLFSIMRYLPVKYARIFVFETDLRVRELRNSGITENLIASIGINTKKKIRTIDILGGIPEQFGKYRIVWNKKWIEKNTNNLNEFEQINNIRD